MRYFALKNFHKYSSSISRTLNLYMEKHQNDSEEKIKQYKKEYDSKIDIIRQICDAMKQIHSIKGDRYNWTEYMKKEFNPLYEKAKELDIFSDEEQKLLEQAYYDFDKYLESDEFVLVHNDLHFDNVFVDNGKIKIIDFERSMYAPRDFELDIFYRMIRKPWKFASEESEEYTGKLSDLELLEERLVQTDSVGNILGYLVGANLNEADPTEISVPVNTYEEAVELFKKWLPEGAQLIEGDKMITWKMTDEKNQEEGETILKESTNPGEIANVTIRKASQTENAPIITSVKFIPFSAFLRPARFPR